MKHGNLKAKCHCKNEFQDKQNGSGVRSCTPVNKSRINGDLKAVKCTSCGATHNQFTERS